MNMRRIIGLAVILVMFGLLTTPSIAGAVPQTQSTFYTTQGQDTWVTIAARFGVETESLWSANGVVNPEQLARGQELFIAGASTQQIFSRMNSVRLDESNLLIVAAQANTLLVSLEAVNQMQAPFVNSEQVVTIPLELLNLRPPFFVAEIAATQTRGPTNLPQVTPTVSATPPPPLARERLGLQGNYMAQDRSQADAKVNLATSELGVGWIKQQVVWKSFEAPNKGAYRSAELKALDNMVNAANERDTKVLLSVLAAPDWARPSSINTGPPANYNDLADFMTFLASRYRGRVSAYEIWNEPNLAVEWTDYPISASDYVAMLSLSYAAIKAVDPNVTVLSAGLAPAGESAVAADDRRYMREMFEAGLVNYVDAIGVHPYGAGNAPVTSFYGNPGAAPSHNNHPTFFFLDNVNDYRALQAEYNAQHIPLWATEFGWPSGDQIGIGPAPGFEFLAYVTEQNQADYIFTALRMGQEWEFMGPMFIYILDFDRDRGLEDTQRAFAITRATGFGRPAFHLIKAAPKY